MTATVGTLSEFIGYVQNGKAAVGAVSIVLAVSRAFTELSTLYSTLAATMGRSLAPLHIVRLIGMPLEVITAAYHSYATSQLPGYWKLLSLAEVSESLGNILESFTIGIWVSEQMSVVGLEALSAAFSTIGGIGIGLQAAGIGLLSWRIYAINDLWDSVEKAASDDDRMTLLVRKPLDAIDAYRMSFSQVLSSDIKDTIGKLYLQHSNDPVKMGSMFDLLKEYHFSMQIHQGISIAIAIISLVGASLVLFGAASMAPIIWGVLGSLTVAAVIHQIVMAISSQFLVCALEGL